MKRIFTILTIIITIHSMAQTDMDGIMMDKKYFCVGAAYGKNIWKNYWEGTLKRDNLNLGIVSSSSVTIMGNYGITSKLNAIFVIPYIKTNASAGQLKGQQGIQDLSTFVKWVAYEKKNKKATLKGIVIAGVSTPLTNYTPDLMPLSIGMKSKTANIRGMVDYQNNNWFGTLSGTYSYRGNVKLDRNTYYTTRLYYTDIVEMPNASNINVRVGYRDATWIIEAIANRWITNGGFDITRNNMPFVSNKMNATTLGLHVRYNTKFLKNLLFVGDAITTIDGRNTGQTSGYSVGAFYAMNLNKKRKADLK
jgi:hypothetical protein